MPPERIEIGSSVQLLVEGKDAENFFRGFVQRLSLPEIEVRDFGGVDQFRHVLAAFVVAPNFGAVRSIGVVRDAEQSVWFPDGRCSEIGICARPPTRWSDDRCSETG